jgi:hypothetical protein
MTTNTTDYTSELPARDSSIQSAAPSKALSIQPSQFGGEGAPLLELSGGVLVAFCAALSGGVLGGVIVPAVCFKLDFFDRFPRVEFILGAIIGGGLGMLLGLVASLIAGVVGRTTSDQQYGFRVQCVVAATAFCATAALAGWTMLQVLADLWASC